MFRINNLEIDKTSQSFKKPLIKTKTLKKIHKKIKLLPSQGTPSASN